MQYFRYPTVHFLIAEIRAKITQQGTLQRAPMLKYQLELPDLLIFTSAWVMSRRESETFRNHSKNIVAVSWLSFAGLLSRFSKIVLFCFIAWLGQYYGQEWGKDAGKRVARIS